MKKYHKVGEKIGKPAYPEPFGTRAGCASASFRSRVLEVVRKIPKGKTLTYKQVAEKAGGPQASRAVGNILNKNFDPQIPCHRVIRSDGKLGGYNRGAEKKKRILEKEKVCVIDEDIIV